MNILNMMNIIILHQINMNNLSIIYMISTATTSTTTNRSATINSATISLVSNNSITTSTAVATISSTTISIVVAINRGGKVSRMKSTATKPSRAEGYAMAEKEQGLGRWSESFYSGRYLFGECQLFRLLQLSVSNQLLNVIL